MAHSGYTNNDFLNLIIIYGECNRIVSRTCRVFAERFPDKHKPNRDMVRRLLNNCSENGMFRPKINRDKPLLDNEESEINVLAFFTAYPHASVRDCRRNLGLSLGTIYRILKKNKWKPFSFYLLHHLQPDDLPRRVEFCEWFLVKTQEDENFVKKIIWCDEAKFSRNGLFNRHNSHFWSDENPQITRERYFQDSWSFNVFCSVKDNRIFGIQIYDENLTGIGYTDILQRVIIAAMNNLCPAEAAEVWYQQDGAPPHNARIVSDVLQNTFQDRWMANNGPHHWPARSPDLTPLDFSIWGCIKSRVYQEPPTTKENMINRVLHAFNSMEPEYISRATSNVTKRVVKCLEVNGANFEHLL